MQRFTAYAPIVLSSESVRPTKPHRISTLPNFSRFGIFCVFIIIVITRFENCSVNLLQDAVCRRNGELSAESARLCAPDRQWLCLAAFLVFESGGSEFLIFLIDRQQQLKTDQSVL